jgi:hypothetical protein
MKILSDGIGGLKSILFGISGSEISDYYNDFFLPNTGNF